MSAWTTEEDDILQKYYQRAGGRILRYLPKRNLNQVWKRAKRFGLTSRGRLWKSTVTQLSPTDAAYIAGLFDGEGCVMIRERPQFNGYEIRLDLTNTHLETLQWVQSLTGGFICKSSPSSQANSQTQCYHLAINRVLSAYSLAKQLLPYSKIKKAKLLKVVEYGDVNLLL